MRTRLSQEAWVLSCTLFFNLVSVFVHVIVSDQCFSNINVLPGVRIKVHSAAVSLGGPWESTFLTSSQVCYCRVPRTPLCKSTWQSEARSGLRRSLSYITPLLSLQLFYIVSLNLFFLQLLVPILIPYFLSLKAPLDLLFFPFPEPTS